MNAVKAIILDLDGTFYDIHNALRETFDVQKKFLMGKTGMSEADAVTFLNGHHIYQEPKDDSMSATELFMSLGFDREEWRLYRERNFNVSQINNNEAVKESEIKKISDKYLLFLLSSSTFEMIKKTLCWLGIRRGLFEAIICSDGFMNAIPFNKKEAFRYISEKYGFMFSEMLSIGDRYQTDIKPMIELGGNGILVSGPRDLTAALNELNV